MSEVPETPPTSLVIVGLARPPRQAFRFPEQADALRLAERLRRADPDAAVRGSATALPLRSGGAGVCH